MAGRPRKINWDAPADLYLQTKRASKVKGKARSLRRRILTAPLHECVQRVVGRPPDERPQYSIRVSAEAGIGKTRLDYRDVEALAWRVDYPESP
jgi:hypothetical protein